MKKSQAILLSLLIVISLPQLQANAQLGGDSLESLFNIGSSVLGGSGKDDEVDFDSILVDPNDEQISIDESKKESFLKDIFLGTSGDRPVHKSTQKLFDYIGKAQKAHGVYQDAKGVYKAISGKNTDGVIGGVESILSVFGLIDPNSAAAAVTVATVGNAVEAGLNEKVAAIAFKDDFQTPIGKYFKEKNKSVVRATQNQQATRLIYSPEGQELLKTQEQFASESVASSNQTVADGGIAAATARQFSLASSELSAAAAKESGEAQSSDSSQRVLKHNSKLLEIAAGQNAAESGQLAEIGDNQTRAMYLTGQQVALQAIGLDKTTTLQGLAANQLSTSGDMLAELRSEADARADDRINKDKRTVRAVNSIYIPIYEKESEVRTSP